jgi:flagella basal body P-ring formation protein FlgA
MKKTGLIMLLVAALMLPSLSEGRPRLVLDPEKQRLLIQEQVEKENPFSGLETRVFLTGRVSEIVLPDQVRDVNDLDIQISAPRGITAGEVAFTVRIMLQGRVIREQRVTARVEVLRNVVVTSRPLPKDSIIDADDVILEKRWVRRLDHNLAAEPEQVIGRRLTMSKGGNVEISLNRTARPLAVRKGRPVRIFLAREGMTISAMGVSEQDGALGDLIKVRNSSTSRTLLGRVEDSSSVRVDF